MKQVGRVKAGIEGLNEILQGGFPRATQWSCRGIPGTGRTPFGTEFIYSGIVEFNEPGIIVVFESSTEKLIRDSAGNGLGPRGTAGAGEASEHLYQP